MTRELRAIADPWLAAALLLGAFLMFGNLGGRGLWQDEAETAMLARRVREHGVPLADDGFNAVSAELGRDRDAKGVWNWSPWLPIYLEAASFHLFGEGETAARLPFTLAGWLCLPVVFLLTLRWFQSIVAARFSTLSLVLSTPFLLNVRQARGYALAALALTACFLALDGLIAGRRRSSAAFVAAALTLFYTNTLVAVAAFAAGAVAVSLLRPDRAGRRRLAAAASVVLAGAWPGLIHFRLLAKVGALDASDLLGRASHGTVLLIAHLLPWPFVLASIWAVAFALPVLIARRARFLLVFAAVYVVILSFAPWLFFRYLVVLAPACAVLIGSALERLSRRSRAVAALALALLATDAYAQIPFGWIGLRGSRWADHGFFHSPMAGLIGEIAHGTPSCDRAAGRYIKEHASSKDLILTNYGDTVLQFETGLLVRGGEQGPPWPSAPDWAVMHPYEISREPGRDWSVLQFFRERVAPGGVGYEVEPFRCVDPVLADAPDPETHLFTRPEKGSSLLVFRRFGADGAGSR